MLSAVVILVEQLSEESDKVSSLCLPLLAGHAFLPFLLRWAISATHPGKPVFLVVLADATHEQLALHAGAYVYARSHSVRAVVIIFDSVSLIHKLDDLLFREAAVSCASPSCLPCLCTEELALVTGLEAAWW